MSVDSTSVGSNWPPGVQAPSADTTRSTEAAPISDVNRRVGIGSALAVRGDQFAQDFGAAARTRRRLRIGDDQVRPFPRRAHVALLPGRERQQFARAVA